VTFTDDTSSQNVADFSSVSNILPSDVSAWFTASKLAISLDEMKIVKFIISDSPQYPLTLCRRATCKDVIAIPCIIDRSHL